MSSIAVTLLKQYAPERAIIAAAAGGHLRAIEYFIALGIEVDACPNGKPTALCFAALNNHVVMAELLLRHGADINYQDKIGNTACIYAAVAQSAECMKLLQRWGADTTLRNDQNKTVASYRICQHQHPLQFKRRNSCAKTKATIRLHDDSSVH